MLALVLRSALILQLCHISFSSPLIGELHSKSGEL